MDKNGQITISGNDFIKGMQNSPALGIHKMINIDASSKPGVLKIARKVKSGVAPSNRVTWMVQSPNSEGIVYVAEDDDIKTATVSGAVMTLSNALGGPSQTTRGLNVFQDYLFKMYHNGTNTYLARYGALSGSPSWSNTWATLATGSTYNLIPSYIGQDGTLYMGLGNIVASLTSATNAGTLNATALDLPSQYTITGISELGQFLVLTVQDEGNGTTADIIPWDRVSASFDVIHKIGGKGAFSPVPFKGLNYMLVGKNGDVYATNLSQSELVRRFSLFTDFPSREFETNTNNIPVPMTVHDQGLLFALGKDSTTASENTTSGIFYLKDDIVTEFTSSAGEGDVAGGVAYNFVLSSNPERFLVSWEKGQSPSVTYGIDFLSNTARATSYSAYIETALYPVGGVKSPKKFQQGEIILAKELATDEGVKVSYRTNLNDTFTEIDTFAYGTATGADNDNLGAVSVINVPMDNVIPCQTIQFKIALTTGSASDTTPELLLARFW